MRLGLETSSLATNRPTGIARYIHQLVTAMSHEWSPQDEVSFLYKLSRWKYRRHWWRPDGVKLRIYHKSYWPIFKRLDLFHGLDGFVPDWLPCKKIVTLHDLAATKLNSEVISTRHFQDKKLRMYQSVATYVDAFIAVSETTRSDAIEILGLPPERIHVTHLGVDARYSPQDASAVRRVRSRYDLGKDYLLFVGSISGRKNTARLVEAFARSRASGRINLVLAGAVAYRGEETLEAIRTHHVEDKVRILNYVADEDLPALYSGALGFVFPTLYEGFGLPVLEALACGTPVLTSDVGAAVEIGGPFARHVDPYSVEAIACGIDALVEDSTARADAAIAYARGFTWKECARKTLDAYGCILGRQTR